MLSYAFRPFFVGIASDMYCVLRHGRIVTDMLTHFSVRHIYGKCGVLQSRTQRVKFLGLVFREPQQDGVRIALDATVQLYLRRLKVALGVRQKVAAKIQAQTSHVQGLCGGQPLYLVGTWRIISVPGVVGID